MFSPAAYFDLNATSHAPLFDGVAQAWEVLPRIAPYLEKHLKPANHGRMQGTPFIGPMVFIGRGTVVDPGACILGPAWIGDDCHIRHGAYIRENVIVGDGCVVGNSTEVKNSLLFNGVQAPHFNYVGDSVLGTKAHLGAGVILSNFRLDGNTITVHASGKRFPTHLRKLGAIIGDHAEIGCHSVLNPGSILGRRVRMYPGTIWQGHLPEGRTAMMPAAFGKNTGT